MRGAIKSRQKLSWTKAVRKYHTHRSDACGANERSKCEYDIIDWDDPELIEEDGILYLKTNLSGLSEAIFASRVGPIPAPRIIQTKTSLKGFVKEYTIKSHNMTFLNRCRLPVINFLSRNRNTKVRLNLACIMTK